MEWDGGGGHAHRLVLTAVQRPTVSQAEQARLMLTLAGLEYTDTRVTPYELKVLRVRVMDAHFLSLSLSPVIVCSGDVHAVPHFSLSPPSVSFFVPVLR